MTILISHRAFLTPAQLLLHEFWISNLVVGLQIDVEFPHTEVPFR